MGWGKVRAAREGSTVSGQNSRKQPSRQLEVRPNTRHTRPHSGERAGTLRTCTPFWQTKDRAQDGGFCPGASPTGCTMASHVVPGGVMAPQRVVGRVGGWASSPQPRGRCMLFAAGLPPLNDRHASVLALKSTCNEPWPVWANPESGEHAMETGVPELCAPGGVLPQRPLTKPTVSHASPTPPVHALSEKISHAS